MGIISYICHKFFKSHHTEIAQLMKGFLGRVIK